MQPVSCNNGNCQESFWHNRIKTLTYKYDLWRTWMNPDLSIIVGKQNISQKILLMLQCINWDMASIPILFLNSTIFNVKEQRCWIWKLVNKFIFDIISFCLDWCKLKSYLKKQWMRKNTFRFARLIQYFTAMFILNTDLNQRDVDAGDAFSLFGKEIN